jgi:glutamate 5-kinase
MVSADCLVLLSDIDGLYTSDPRKDPGAEHVPEVTELTKQHWDMAGGPGSNHGSGGMRTKLDAARIAMGAGCRLLIAPGQQPRPISAVRAGAKVTWFLPGSTPRAARKQWIAGTLQPKGKLVVDAGAVAALAEGKSLLPAGVTRVDGEFERGDAVAIVDQEGAEIGRGICAYGAGDSRAIAGRRSAEIGDILDYRGRDEMIHRDNLVLMESETGK